MQNDENYPISYLRSIYLSGLEFAYLQSYDERIIYYSNGVGYIANLNWTIDTFFKNFQPSNTYFFFTHFVFDFMNKPSDIIFILMIHFFSF